MSEIHVSLSRAQQNNLRKGKNVRISHKALQQQEIPLVVTAAALKRINSAIRGGRGVQISSKDLAGESEEEFEGGNIFKKMKRGAKNLGKTISKGANEAVSGVRYGAAVVERQAPGAIKQASHEVGRAVEQGKKYVPKDVVKAGVEGAAFGITAATGNAAAGEAFKRGVNPAVDAVYQTNLARGSVGKNFAMNYGKNLATQEAKQGVKNLKGSSKASGAGILPLGTRGGRLQKGSQAARDYMAAIRNKRGKVSGQIHHGAHGGSVRSHVARIEDGSRNNVRLNLDDTSGNFMSRQIHGTGFLPL